MNLDESGYGWDDPRVTSYALGDMGQREKVDFEQLVSRSPQLRANVAEIQEIAALLRHEFQIESNTAASPSVTIRILPHPKRRTALLASGLAVAASIVALLIWHFWFGAPPSSVGKNLTFRNVTSRDDLALSRRSVLNTSIRSMPLSEFASVAYGSRISDELDSTPSARPSNALVFGYHAQNFRQRHPASMNDESRFNFSVTYQLQF
jgi:hypothetical protein